MKSLCVTGAVQSDLDMVEDILLQAGMAAPKPSARDESINICYWHEQVMDMAFEDASNLNVLDNLGRFWEQLASDIFVANIKSECWGWANTRSVALLQFWLKFESQLNFILVCTSPERMLASAIANDTEFASVDAVMVEWQTQHQRMLRFYHRNPQRCLLIEAGEYGELADTLIDRCRTQWKLQLHSTSNMATSPVQYGALEFYLARQITAAYPQTASLCQELDATIVRPGDSQHFDQSAALSIPQIIADYRSLRDGYLDAKQIEVVHKKLANAQASLEEADAERRQQKTEFGAKLKEFEQENELLLGQLQEVQEELERTVSQYEADKEAWDKQFRLSVELQQQIEVLTERNALLEKEKAVLTARSAFTVENKAQEADLRAMQYKLKESEHENELLQLQVHQVQEELEYHFKQGQEVQERLKFSDERWQRMLDRNPEYCDFAAIEIVGTGEDGSVSWRVEHLDAAGRSIPELQFTTIVEDGVAGFVFKRASDSLGPLVRWPVATAPQKELTLIPAGTRDQIQQRLENLVNLGTQDWELLKTLARLLCDVLEAPVAIDAPAALAAEVLREGLGKFGQCMELFSATLRYDHVSLKREQVNPDYEHLWLSLENVAFGGHRWPVFEFRLSCANVRPGHFGSHPKLEFPEATGMSVLEAWVDEAYDDFGPKLELRFALPEAMDIAIWQRLSQRDQSVLKSLILRLPAILATLEGNGIKLRRSWADWIQVSGEIRRITTLCTGQRDQEAVQAVSSDMAAISPNTMRTSAVKRTSTRKAK